MNTQQQYLSEEAVRALCGKGEPCSLTGWSAESLSDGWRPCLDEELRMDGDEIYDPNKGWTKYTGQGQYGKFAMNGNYLTRTKRELPLEAQPDKPAESLVGKTVWLTHKFGARYEVAVSKESCGFIHGDFKLWHDDKKEWSKNHGIGAFDHSEHTIHHSDPTKPEWRLMEDDEILEGGDEVRHPKSDYQANVWIPYHSSGGNFSVKNNKEAFPFIGFEARTRRPIPKPETPAAVSSPREPNELRYDKVEIGMSLWARSRRYPELCYKLNRVRRITIDSFYADYTCLTHNSTYGDTAFAINDYKFYSADPRETPAVEPAKVEAFVPTKGQRIQKKNSGKWSEPYVADYEDSLYAAAVRGGAEFRLAEEPQPTEPMPALVISTTGTGDDDFARAAQRQQKANDAAAAMRAVLDSYRTTQPEPNLNNMNAQQSNTLPTVGSRWAISHNTDPYVVTVKSISNSGIFVRGFFCKGVFTPSEWQSMARTHLPNRRERKAAEVASTDKPKRGIFRKLISGTWWTMKAATVLICLLSTPAGKAASAALIGYFAAKLGW